MLVNTKPKINTKLILQHPIQSPESSHNAIFDTGTTKCLKIPNTPLINKNNPPSHLMLKYQMAHY